MEKISEEFPSAIVREGGLAALLNYLDFFSIAVQRTALQAASNCCRNVSADHFSMIHAVWPIIRNCLGYSDQRLVEFACLCVIRVIDSYYRASTENLEALVDRDLIKAVNVLRCRLVVLHSLLQTHIRYYCELWRLPRAPARRLQLPFWKRTWSIHYIRY